MAAPSAPVYRLYLLDKDGHIRKAKVLHCQSDAEALTQAELAASGRRAELWDGGRKLAELPPAGSPAPAP